jgi:hypothetical protein
LLLLAEEFACRRIHTRPRETAQDTVCPPHHPQIDYCPIEVSTGDPADDRFGVIFAAKDCTAIFPFRIMNVSVANS